MPINNIHLEIEGRCTRCSLSTLMALIKWELNLFGEAKRGRGERAYAARHIKQTRSHWHTSENTELELMCRQ